ncbi:hypothetical protein L6258_03920, partial [Candidatus Parcubacteria bacterium]|nr:hypothetical protein [Candidatus Parcubacteria bacterium]
IAVVEGSALPEADVGERFRKDWCHILCRDSEIEQAALNAIPRSERINECAGRPMLLFFGSTQVVQALLNQGFGGRIEIVDRLSQE